MGAKAATQGRGGTAVPARAARGRGRKSGFVFTNLNGDPMAPNRLTRTFRQLAAEAGLPPVRLHDLRHGAATLEGAENLCHLGKGPTERGGAFGMRRADHGPTGGGMIFGLWA